MLSIEVLTENLPDQHAALLFFAQLSEKFPGEAKKLTKNESLLSDVLTLAAFSPLLSTTILQNPDYVSWLNRQRTSTKVCAKEEILESLARFALVNTDVETNILLARFRRRELLRIYLRDIRGLGTIVEITEEISNLADAILEYALRIARQELDNRYGNPLTIDEKGRDKPAQFCIVALGKLGSKELNYSSDIDLLFIYSNDGKTSGQGTRDAVTNREYFVKLAEFITKLVGGQAGEGAAYRVDLRLRPHGRVGALAISLGEAVNYYQKTAQSWERQVLIRSRSSAGDDKIFQKFFEQVKSSVFSSGETIENALQNVRLSKEKINSEKISDRNFNVKLGSGGIREIEFVAQALQLAYAGKDEWLRAAHTLISLSRLADRKLISESELTQLFEAYEFLRRLEHRLQMENGLQTHLIPNEADKRFSIAKRMNFRNTEKFDASVNFHTTNVSRIYKRVFRNEEHINTFTGAALAPAQLADRLKDSLNLQIAENRSDVSNLRRFGRAKDLPFENSPDNFSVSQSNQTLKLIFSSLEKSDVKINLDNKIFETLRLLSETSPHFAEMLASNPNLIKNLPAKNEDFIEENYLQTFLAAVKQEKNFAWELAILRKTWSRFLLEIVTFDVFGKINTREAKRRQTNLAEASIETALFITRRELERRFSLEKIDDFPFAVLGLGKLGGGGMDYNSDLDLILLYDDEKSLPVSDLTHAEFYSRAAEIFVTFLSSLTREGYLYRVDLRLRPDGKNGANVSSKTSFLNYLETRAAMWEWLAYVKLRGVAGDLDFAKDIETNTRKIIHKKAQKFKTQDSNLKILRDETWRIRERLEEKANTRNGKEIDIKFGAGGMLDVYFAMRFLQLRDNLQDDAANRSTVFMLKKLYENESLNTEDFQNFANGYEFLSELDHNLRLTIGRSTRLPLANQRVLQMIAKRMELDSVKDLLEKLTTHRLEIRSSFENILKN
jgi:glutamate-ammonia-ligase adenylyltransferase